MIPTAQTTAKTSKRTTILGWLLLLGTLAAVAYEWPRPKGAKFSQADVQKSLVPATLEGTYPCVEGSVSGGALTSALSVCMSLASQAEPTETFETDLRYGSFIVRQTDLTLRDIFNAPLERAYSSSDWGSPSQDHAFGFNATDSFDIAPTGSRFPYTYLNLMLADNDFLYFKRISSGTGFADAVYLHTETSTSFYGATIAWNGDGWTLRQRDGTQMIFPEAYGARNLAQGAAYEIRNARGDKLLLKRDQQRNLQEVLTPHHHWIRLQDDDEGHIVAADDDAGQAVRYQYDSAGMLSDVLYSNGAARHYEYENRLMTSVTDEHGKVLVQNWYREGRVVQQLFNNRDRYAYEYSWLPGSHYVNEVIVTLPNGNKEDIFPGSTVPSFLRDQQ